jgi:hypothetical protein
VPPAEPIDRFPEVVVSEFPLIFTLPAVILLPVTSVVVEPTVVRVKLVLPENVFVGTYL